MRNEDRPKSLEGEEGIWSAGLAQGIRSAVRFFIEGVVGEELTAALGATPYARVGTRVGYRNGSKRRDVTASAGKVSLELPRGRFFGEGGRTTEWESRALPRYQRRCADVDAAVLNCYLSGVNTRRVKVALRPLLRGAPLSKSAVSRLVGQLKSRFDAWRERSLKDETIVNLLLDGFGVNVRLGGRVVRVPVLAAVGVRSDGEKVLLALEMCASEATASWEALVRSLEARGLRAPILAIVDGNPGLLRAIANAWPGTKVQRCVVHKLRNLLAKAPRHLSAEVAADYRAFIYAETGEEVRAGYERFLRKWDKACPGVATSLREAGEALLTFTLFPTTQWKALRTTNSLERLNGEFRRRVKTQGGFPSEQSVLVLLFALVDSGLVRMRKMVGWRQMPEVLLAFGRQAA